MKKSLILWLLMTMLAVFSLPAALILTDSGKEKILITEEILSGNPAEAEGIVLRIPSHWGRQLFWDTEYTIGEGKTKSSFTFSSGKVSWKEPEAEVQVGLFFLMNDVLTESYRLGSGNNFDWRYGYYEMIGSVAERTKGGEKHTEIIRFGDYNPYYPLLVGFHGPIEHNGNYYQDACGFLRDFFHIQAAEDSAEVTVERNGQGDIINVSVCPLIGDENVDICSVAADGGEGVYLVYGLRNVKTGEFADRGQNRGIFYFPYEKQESGSRELRKMDLTQVRKLQELTDNIIPLEMLTDQEGEFLFLAAEDEEGFSLFVYRLEGEIPVLTRKIPVKTDHSSFCQMSLEDGGILLTWKDNSFSFVAEEKGEYRFWRGGTFPESSPFSEEHVCTFDRERLTLAAYENWYSLNVLLAVYDEHGQTYSGRYVHSGNEDTDAGYDYDTYSRIIPQGLRVGQPGSSWSWGTWDREFVEPLEIFRRSE